MQECNVTERSRADAQSLTGVWHGLYTYPLDHGSVSFVATLIETVSRITGSTHEPCVVGDCAGETLYASLSGNRNGRAITFVKTYDPVSPEYGTIDYEGTLSEDGTEIEGRWRVPRGWSGKFLMIRPGGAATTVGQSISVTV
jgi:hypothetical protein